MPNLYGREPVEMKVRDKVTGKFHDQVRDVFDAFFDMTTANSAEAFRLPLDQIIHNRKIVRRQIPKHVDVSLKQTEIDAHRIKVEQISQLGTAHDFFHLAHRAGVNECVIDH